MTARFGQWGGLLYLMPTSLALAITTMVVTAFGHNAAMTPELVVSLLLGAPAATLLSSRAVFGRLCERKRRRTRTLITRLEQAITEPPQSRIVPSPVRGTITIESEEESVLVLRAGTE